MTGSLKRIFENPEPDHRPAKIAHHEGQNVINELPQELFQIILNTFTFRDLLKFEGLAKPFSQFAVVRWEELRRQGELDLACCLEEKCPQKWQHLAWVALNLLVDSRASEFIPKSCNKYEGLMLRIPALDTFIRSRVTGSLKMPPNYKLIFEQHALTKARSGDFLLTGLSMGMNQREFLESRVVTWLKQAASMGASEVGFLAQKTLLLSQNELLFFALRDLESNDGRAINGMLRSYPKLASKIEALIINGEILAKVVPRLLFHLALVTDNQHKKRQLLNESLTKYGEKAPADVLLHAADLEGITTEAEVLCDRALSKNRSSLGVELYAIAAKIKMKLGKLGEAEALYDHITVQFRGTIPEEIVLVIFDFKIEQNKWDEAEDLIDDNIDFKKLSSVELFDKAYKLKRAFKRWIQIADNFDKFF